MVGAYLCVCDLMFDCHKDTGVTFFKLYEKYCNTT